MCSLLFATGNKKSYSQCLFAGKKLLVFPQRSTLKLGPSLIRVITFSIYKSINFLNDGGISLAKSSSRVPCQRTLASMSFLSMALLKRSNVISAFVHSFIWSTICFLFLPFPLLPSILPVTTRLSSLFFRITFPKKVICLFFMVFNNFRLFIVFSSIISFDTFLSVLFSQFFLKTTFP